MVKKKVSDQKIELTNRIRNTFNVFFKQAVHDGIIMEINGRIDFNNYTDEHYNTYIKYLFDCSEYHYINFCGWLTQIENIDLPKLTEKTYLNYFNYEYFKKCLKGYYEFKSNVEAMENEKIKKAQMEVFPLLGNGKHKVKIGGDHTNKIWFKVGLLFATGEIDKLIRQYTSPNKIAEHLGTKSFDKYILATKNDYRRTNVDKNIFADPDKLKKIYNHCIENEIEMIDGFKNRIQSI